MIKSISFTILSAEGEYLLIKWLDLRPFIECLHVDCQHIRLAQHIDSEQQLSNGDGYQYPQRHYTDHGQQQTPPFHDSSIQHGHLPQHNNIANQNQKYVTFTFLKALKGCKSLKTLHINTVYFLDDTWSSLGEFLVENSSLTKLYLDCKSNDYGPSHTEAHHSLQRSFAVFVSCLTKNTSLEELRLSNLHFAPTFNRKKIQNLINITRRKGGQPEFTFLEPSQPIS